MAFRNFLKARAQHRKNRINYFKLLQQSNRDLADIGLSRGNLHGAIGEARRWL
ncbi:MAG: hypothetical protein ACR2O1_12205 [Boseongicola sp.]